MPVRSSSAGSPGPGVDFPAVHARMGSWEPTGRDNVMRELRALTPDLVGDLVGTCAPCTFWQTVPHNGHVPERDPGDLLAGWVEEVTRDWGPPGRIAYVDGEPVGYVLLAPARHVPRLAAFATAPSDPATLMLLTTCVADAGAERDANRDATRDSSRDGNRDTNRGLGKALVQSAAKEALRHKVRAIEAIGARPAAPGRHACVLEVAVLERHGFHVKRDHALYPRLRLDLRTVLAIRDEAASLVGRALARVPRVHPVPETHPDGATRARSAE